MKLSDILQASELAVCQNDVYPVPDNSMDTLLNVSGILVGGQTLTQRKIKRVKPSQHSFLSAQTTTYSGFKIGGNPIILANVGTQPHSHSALRCLGVYAAAAQSGFMAQIYLSSIGKLMVNNVAVGNATNDPYLTTANRGIKFIIVHVCGAGGGGGGGGRYNDGKGGGSGSVYTAIVNITSFTGASPLKIVVNPGGTPGGGRPDAGNGVDGDPSYIRGGTPFGYTDIGVTIPAGAGGDGGAGDPGVGGAMPTIAADWENHILYTLSLTAGSGGSSQNGGGLPNSIYTDPNPSETAVHTNQSFSANPYYGQGGRGGDQAWNGTDGERGHGGAVYIYY